MDELKGSRVLLVGLERFLWGHVAEALKAAGAEMCPTSLWKMDVRNEGHVLTAVVTDRPDVVVYLEDLPLQFGSSALSDALRAGMNMIHAASVAKARLVIVSYDGVQGEDYDAIWKSILVLARAHRKDYRLTFSQIRPCSCYGPWDAFKRERARLVPWLITKIQNAKESKTSLLCWGKSEDEVSLLHARDAARAIAAACALPGCDIPINLAPKKTATLGEVVSILSKNMGFEGEAEWNKQDIFPREQAEDDGVAREALGWEPKIDLHLGLAETVKSQLRKEDAKEGAARA